MCQKQYSPPFPQKILGDRGGIEENRGKTQKIQTVEMSAKIRFFQHKMSTSKTHNENGENEVFQMTKDIKFYKNFQWFDIQKTNMHMS